MNIIQSYVHLLWPSTPCWRKLPMHLSCSQSCITFCFPYCCGPPASGGSSG